MSTEQIEAADGLTLFMGKGEPWRVAWGDGFDWLGPVGCALRGTPARPLSTEPFDGEDDLGAYHGVRVGWEPELPVHTSVRAYTDRALLVFRIEAAEDAHGSGTGSFERPWIAWPWLQPARRAADGVPPGSVGYGHLYSEFALPTFAGVGLDDFFLIPEPRRPAVVQPLWLNAPGTASLMLAPLDAFHEQVIAVPRGPENADQGVSCGWHGDLDSVPKGFASELALWAGPGPRGLLETHTRGLLQRHRTRRPTRYADPAISRLSYWTDNGGAYWYRTAPGLDLPTTLERVVEGLREIDVPAHAIEIDSWFYPHQITRSVNPDGQQFVPPTGMLRWEPRDDVLPDGITGLRERLGDPPLILHSRHFSSASPYFERFPAWTDGDRAHPSGPELFDRLLSQAAGWGAIQYEQDWMVESFLGVRGLREKPGRARAWQETLDRLAAEHGLTLLWCMSTPADFFQTLTLDRVTAIRTSGDYRYLIGSAALWAWFLYGNALARALGLNVFKDVFLSRSDGEGLDGDPHAEVEALLSALSAGPVGLGDRIARTDPQIVARTCRSDGVLIKPDLPIAALERCFRAHAHLVAQPLIAETHSTHAGARWHYVVSLHAWRGAEPIEARVDLADLGDLRPTSPVLLYDWRTREMREIAPDGGWDLRLEPRGWDYRVVAPILAGDIAVVGDASKYASAGDRRLRGVQATPEGVRLEVLGAPGENVCVVGWSRHALRADGAAVASFTRDARTGRWELACRVGARTWEAVELRPT